MGPAAPIRATGEFHVGDGELGQGIGGGAHHDTGGLELEGASTRDIRDVTKALGN